MAQAPQEEGMESQELDEEKGNEALNKQLKEQLKEESMHLDGLLAKAYQENSLANTMEVFRQLLGNPNWDTLSKFIATLSSSIGDMFSSLPTLVAFAGKEEIDRLYAIFSQFQELLRATKKTVANVTVQAKIQESNMQDIIEIIEEYESRNERNIDKAEFQDCINTLSQWISDQAIVSLINDWDLFCKDCKKTHSKWVELSKNSKSDNRNKSSKAAKIIGGIALVGGLLVAGVSVACLALPAAAIASVLGSGIASTIATSTVAVLASDAVLFGSVVAVEFGIVSSIIGYFVDKKGQALANDVFKQAHAIRENLKNMLVFGEKIQNQLNDLDTIRTAHLNLYCEQLKDATARRRIKRVTKSIIDYLKSYQKEGKKIVHSVEKAQKEMIDSMKTNL